MKIVDISSSDSQAPVLAVVAAEPVGPYALRLTFNTAEQRIVDFGDFLRHAQHPKVRSYLNEERFRQFRLINGNVNWNDYDLIFPVADLYSGKVA
jgi:Protein of unknown function (DUF2442)